MGDEEKTKDFHRVVAAVIRSGSGRVLISERLAKAVFPLYWEFPGGKVEPGETDEQALIREIQEELGVEIEVGDALGVKVHEYDDFVVDFRVFNAKIVNGRPRSIACKTFRWVRVEDLGDYQFPPADEDAIRRLMGK
jgi:mutator protein MutT